MAGITAVYIDLDTFTVVSDRTSDFIVGRRVKANCGIDGYKYGTVESSSYSSPNTTVNLASTNDDLTSNLAQVWYGSVKPGTKGNVGIHPHEGDEGDGGSADFVNVKGYGAVGDGTTDDITAIQAAVDVAVRNGGGSVFFPAGVYRVTSPILIERKEHGDEADGKRKMGGVKLIGTGATSNDSIYEGDCQSTLLFNGASGGLLDISSTYHVEVERFLMIYDSATADYLVQLQSEDTPVNTQVQVRFSEVVFRADQAPSEAQVVIRDTAMVIFETCLWVTSDGDILLIGEDSGENSTNFDGKVSHAVFRDCIFAGDMRIKNAETILFENSAWWPKKGGTAGSRILFEGDKFLSLIQLQNCSAMNNGDDTGTFLDMSDGLTGRKGLIVVGGEYGTYDTVFITASGGPAIFLGPRFNTNATGGNDIVVTDGAEPVMLYGDHTDTITAGEDPVVDNRTLPLRPYIVHTTLAADHTFSSTNMETVISIGGVKFRGGPIRVTYGFTINSARSTQYMAKVRAGGVADIAGSFMTVSVASGDISTHIFSRVMDSPALGIGNKTMTLSMKQSTEDGADWSKVEADDDVNMFSTFLQIEEL